MILILFHDDDHDDYGSGGCVGGVVDADDEVDNLDYNISFRPTGLKEFV